MKDLILAYDLGTTGIKATLFDDAGGLAGSAIVHYPTSHPRPGWAEQNADDWWHATCEATRQLLAGGANPAHIAVISFSGHMMGCLPVDGSGVPLGPSLIHADTRSEDICAELRRTFGDERLYHLTGNRIAPQYTLPKIGWLRAAAPETFAQTACYLQAKDYLVFKLTGRLGVTDYSDASLTGLMDIRRRRWADELLEAVGITAARLPEMVPAATVVGEVTSAAAAAAGLAAGTPVVMGGGDGACATVGAGALAPGEAYVYGGGTAWISMVAEQPVIDPAMRIFNLLDLDPAKANVLGTVQCAGSAFEWFAEEIGAGDAAAGAVREDRFRELDRLAQAAPPGSDGLFFLPYLMGERSPLWDANARGVFFGLSLSHGRGHLTRAVLEGVAYALKSVAEVMEEQAGGFAALAAIGGLVGGEVFPRILASALNKPLILPSHPGEATSRGAAIAGAVACGRLRSYAEARGWIREEGRITPDAGASARYATCFRFWQGLYPALKDKFREAREL